MDLQRNKGKQLKYLEGVWTSSSSMWLLKPGMMKVSLRVQIASVAVQSSGQAKIRLASWQAQHGGEGLPGVCASDPGGAKEEFLWAGTGVVQKPSYCPGLVQQRELLGARVT